MKRLSILNNYNTESILLIFGFFLLLTHYYIFPIDAKYQMIILLTLVFLVGVPHGALDFLVEEQTKVALKQKFSIKKFVTVYLFRLFSFALIWIFPWVAFSIFMIFSIFHFGETDMAGILKTKKNAVLLYVAYGSFLLAILFLGNLSEIKDSLPIIKTFVENSKWYAFLVVNRNLLILVFSLFLTAAIIYQYSIKNITISFTQIIRFVLLITIITLLPLLLAFTFYFALWHSILSVRNIIAYFKHNNNSAQFMLFCNKSLLFSLLALGGIVILYFMLNYFLPDMNLLFALLVILSVLTLPHLQVMHRMYQNLGNQNNFTELRENKV